GEGLAAAPCCATHERPLPGRAPLRVLGLRPLADGERVRRETLRLVEPALEERTHRLPERGEPEIQRLAELDREPRVGVHLGVDAHDVAELEQALQSPVAALQRPLAALHLARQTADLGRRLETLLDVLGTPERPSPAVERIRERGGVADATGHRDRFLAEPLAPLR